MYMPSPDITFKYTDRLWLVLSCAYHVTLHTGIHNATLSYPLFTLGIDRGGGGLD